VRVLVVNAGSSSLKLRLVADGELTGSVDLTHSGGRVEPADLSDALATLGPADAVGHRVVHGGQRFTDPVIIDDEVIAALDDLVDLDPLHQPIALALIGQVRRERPDVPHVACFDTAFHATMPPAAATYAVPADWRDRGIRKFGFHGLSHSWAAGRAAALVGRPVADLSTAICHLGSGASLAAVRGGRSIDTTMGFTPLDGLVMATRPGWLDPGVLTWLARRDGATVEQLEHDLYERSGLLGLTGTGDLASVLERAAAGDADAQLGLDVYEHRLRAAIGAMVAALAGVDVLVFTGGAGEHAPAIRARTAEGLAYLGVALDPAVNAMTTADGDISAPDARVRTVVVTAREDLEIARLATALLA
jgi:acetate kinase